MGKPREKVLNHFADGQGKQGHGVSPRAKGATHVPWVPESGWPLPRRGGFIGPKDAQRVIASGVDRFSIKRARKPIRSA